jgi:hypothetical protein
MNELLKILIIQFSVITVMDITPFWSDLTKFIYKKLNPGKEYYYQQLPKPLGCSFCMGFWLVFIYLTIHHISLFNCIAISLSSTYVFLIVKILLKNINNFLQRFL